MSRVVGNGTANSIVTQDKTNAVSFLRSRQEHCTVKIPKHLNGKENRAYETIMLSHANWSERKKVI